MYIYIYICWMMADGWWWWCCLLSAWSSRRASVLDGHSWMKPARLRLEINLTVVPFFAVCPTSNAALLLWVSVSRWGITFSSISRHLLVARFLDERKEHAVSKKRGWDYGRTERIFWPPTRPARITSTSKVERAMRRAHFVCKLNIKSKLIQIECTAVG